MGPTTLSVEVNPEAWDWGGSGFGRGLSFNFMCNCVKLAYITLKRKILCQEENEREPLGAVSGSHGDWTGAVGFQG